MVTYFFRKKRATAFSIEELFATIRKYLPVDIEHRSVQMPEFGARPKVILRNGKHAHNFSSAVNHITGDVHYLAFFLPRKNTILTIHDLRPLYRGNYLKRIALKYLWFSGPAKAAAYVTVISEATRLDLLKHVPGIGNKVYVIPNCLSPAFDFSPKPFNNSDPRILHLGTKENKNLERLISALKGVKCHLHIVGPLTEEQLKLLKENDLNFSNSENLPIVEIVAEYRKADIVSFISLQEGFGLPIIEAQAVGRAVISSTVSSMPEVAGEGALLVDPYSISEIRKGILQLINDGSFRDTLIALGQENIKRYQPAVVAEKYAQLYRKILAEKA